MRSPSCTCSSVQNKARPNWRLVEETFYGQGFSLVVGAECWHVDDLGLGLNPQ
jgi:hypothetical protein